MPDGYSNMTERDLMPPVLSLEQMKLARQRSLELRQHRAEVKYMLAEGAWSLADMFRYAALGSTSAGDEACAGMKVMDALTALPGIGKPRAAKLLDQAGIPHKNTFRACGPRQRERLLQLL
jgi:hypothetical protein